MDCMKWIIGGRNVERNSKIVMDIIMILCPIYPFVRRKRNIAFGGGGGIVGFVALSSVSGICLRLVSGSILFLGFFFV